MLVINALYLVENKASFVVLFVCVCFSFLFVGGVVGGFLVFSSVCVLKIVQMHLFINSYSWKYETNALITFLFIQMVHRIGILWLVLQSYHQTP